MQKADLRFHSVWKEQDKKTSELLLPTEQQRVVHLHFKSQTLVLVIQKFFATDENTGG